MARTDRASSAPFENQASPAGETSKQSVLPALAVLAGLTVIAAGAGWMAGSQLVENVENMLESEVAEDGEPLPPPPKFGPESRLHAIPPVITNLAAPSETWVRLDASIILDEAASENPEVLASRIAGDVLAYMRTVSLAQIQGPAGLLHLRADLSDRVAIRSDDQVRELIVETLVVQ